MSKNKEYIITFHNPNNEKDSQLIAEDFISRASQNVVKEYLLNNGEIRENDIVNCRRDKLEQEPSSV